MIIIFGLAISVIGVLALMYRVERLEDSIKEFRIDIINLNEKIDELEKNDL